MRFELLALAAHVSLAFKLTAAAGMSVAGFLLARLRGARQPWYPQSIRAAATATTIVVLLEIVFVNFPDRGLDRLGVLAAIIGLGAGWFLGSRPKPEKRSP